MNDSAAMPLSSRATDALERAEKLLLLSDICPYLDLKMLRPVSDPVFRARFRALFVRYYGMNTAGLTDAFRDRFFATLFDGPVIVDGEPAFEAILTELHAIPRRQGDQAMPFSFVSKLVAMHDENSPIVDRHVLSFFGLSMPATTHPVAERIRRFRVLLGNIRSSYIVWASEPRIEHMLDRLRARDRRLGQCHVVRLLDFLVWKVGNEKLLENGGHA